MELYTERTGHLVDLRVIFIEGYHVSIGRCPVGI